MSRTVISAASITSLIRAQMTLLPDCAGCTCHEVRWRKPDGAGCNWIISRLDGPRSLGCLDQLVPLLDNLREHWNVPEPVPRRALPMRRTVLSTFAPVVPADECPVLATEDLLDASREAARESRAMLRMHLEGRAREAELIRISKSAIATSQAVLGRAFDSAA